MFKQTLQEKGTKLIGRILIPILLIIPYYNHSLLTENYTILINDRSSASLFWCCAIPSFLFCAYRLYKVGKHLPRWKYQYIAFLIFGFSAALIPYPEVENFWSGLHVFMAFVVFAWLSAMLWVAFQVDPKKKNVFPVLLFTVVILVLATNRVSGLSEWFYCAGVSFLLV